MKRLNDSFLEPSSSVALLKRYGRLTAAGQLLALERVEDPGFRQWLQHRGSAAASQPQRPAPAAKARSSQRPATVEGKLAQAKVQANVELLWSVTRHRMARTFSDTKR